MKGLWGMLFSVFGPMLTKKLFIDSAISLGLLIILSFTLSWVMFDLFVFLVFIIDLIPSHIFLLLLLFSNSIV